MSIHFDSVLVDFLLSPTSQDEFRRMKLQEKLYALRHDVHVDQIEDVMQILWNVYDELWLFKNWKLHGIEDDCNAH